MGYYATGTVNITFADKGKEDEAAAALKADVIAGIIAAGNTPDPDALPDTFDEFFSDEWDALPAETHADGSIRYTGYVTEKWLAQEEFATTIAPFASELTGDFAGEDNAQWGWRLLPNGTFDEFSYVPVPDYVHTDFERDSAAIKTILSAIESGDDAAILRAAKIATVAYMTAEQLSRFADDADTKVREAVTQRIIDSAFNMPR